ncbi:hypothetical protein [Paenarthrobacter nitroguajacolicus]|uniref:hypothetical protein n=1 Tax=Paenarthrobacter nitroguajacolicus TaxID=211146 RepID=UPI000A6E47B1|nr:hypothetical protein [Paenarthrobacter nitroguajacolicus]
MQALVLMGFVLATAVMWVGVILMMLTGLHRAEHGGGREAPDPAQEKDREKSEAPPRGRP